MHPRTAIGPERGDEEEEGRNGEGRKIGDLIIPRALSEGRREGGRDDGWMDVSPSSRPTPW